MYVLGGICAGAGALGVWYFGTGQDPKVHGSGAVTMIVLCCLFLALGAYFIYSIAHFRVVLTSDAITVQTLSEPRTYRRADLSGWSLHRPSKGPNVLVLGFRDSSRSDLRIPQYFSFDGAFREWLAGLGDLDRQEREAVDREVAENVELGSTREERLARFAGARRTSIALTSATIAACGWVLFFPYRYALAVSVLAAIPWIAVLIVARSHCMFRIDQKRNDPHPSVGIAFMMPGFILALRAIFDIHLIGWRTPLIITLAISAALWLAAWKADESLQRNRATAVLILVLALAYGFGAMALSNALFDRGGATEYAARVLDKYISHGRSTTYRLHLDAWGPQPAPNWVDVSRTFYNATPQGSAVCVYLRRGAWHVPWYVVRHCAR